MFEAFQYQFMQNALLAGLLIAVACGVIGALVVVNRMVFVSGGVAHAAYGGIGLAFFFGFSPLIGAGLFAVAVSIIMGLITLRHKERTDTIIGAIWAAGMALGILLIDITPGYNVDLMSYLFGSIMTVTTADLVFMLVLDCVIVGVVSLYYKAFLALSYDEEFAALRGVKVTRLYIVLLVLASLTIVITIRAVGLILVIALLTIPPFLAERYAGSLGRMMFFSTIKSAIFIITGLWLSYIFNLTSGAVIIMVATAVMFLFLVIERVIKRLSLRKIPSL